MNTSPHALKVWIDQIHKWGLGEFAAFFLEAAGPLNLITAQILYMGQPLFKQTVVEEKMVALANMLEDPQETLSFTALLREEK